MKDDPIDDRYRIDCFLKECPAGRSLSADLLDQPDADLEAALRSRRELVGEKPRVRKELVWSKVAQRERRLRRSDVPQRPRKHERSIASNSHLVDRAPVGRRHD